MIKDIAQSKLGHFKRAKRIFKILLASWVVTMSTMVSRSLQIGTLRICRSKGARSKAAKYCPLNFEDDQIILDLKPWLHPFDSTAAGGRIFFIPPTLTAYNFAAL